jgi:hypothetical protein
LSAKFFRLQKANFTAHLAKFVLLAVKVRPVATVIASLSCYFVGTAVVNVFVGSKYDAADIQVDHLLFIVCSKYLLSERFFLFTLKRNF